VYLVVLITLQNLVGIGAVVLQVLIFCELGLEIPIHATKIGVSGDLTL